MRQSLSLSVIRLDGGTQARAGLNEEKVHEYRERMDAGDEFPPLNVVYDGTNYWLYNGFHRHAAAGLAGKTVFLADVVSGTQRDARRKAARANSDHGIPRTSEDKRRAVLIYLEDEEWAAYSDRKIADELKVSPTFVGKLRKEVTVHVDSDETRERKYVTRHGTEAVMRTGNIGRVGDPAPLNRMIEANVDAAAYEDIHSLQRFVVVWIGKQWLDDVAKQVEVLEFMKADGKYAYWTILGLDLARAGKVFRKNGLVQALNNALDTLRYVQASREKITQPALSQPSEPAQASSADECAVG